MKSPFSHEAVSRMIMKGSETHFDTILADVFNEVKSQFQIWAG
jgi:HD-GYP domain-containing protein (c-di-GMP phosphodiesterase class II)